MKTMRIAATALVALMLVSAMSAVGAQTLRERLEQRRETWASRRENFRDAYSEWLTARADFLSARAAWVKDRSASNLSTLVEKGREVARLAYELHMGYLSQLRARVDATHGLSDNDKTALLNELDGYIAAVENYKVSIQSAENGQQVRERATELKEYWESIRVRIKQITAELIIAGFRAMVERVEAFAARVEAKINELKDNGVDTTQLESWLSQLNADLQTARERIDNAEAKVDEITDNVTFRNIFSTAIDHAKNALTYLRKSLVNLKNIVLDMRRANRSITLTGSGTISFNGTGTAVLSGSGLVKIETIENGELTVSSNANVSVSGEGTQETLDTGDIKYTGYGSARVTGHDITVTVTGTNISGRASGTGTVTLTGTGEYSTYGENAYVDATWAGTAISLGAGEVQG